MSETTTPTPETLPLTETEAAPAIETAPASVTKTETEALVTLSSPAEEPEGPVDPKIDPEPEASPIAEPDPEPLPEIEPPIEPTPHPEPDPEPRAEAAVAEKPLVKPAPVQAAPPAPEPEPEPEESFADIFSEFQRTSARRTAGSTQIRGTIVSITQDSVLVDIGYKSEGILPLTAFASAKTPPQPGDQLQVSVKGRDTDGYYELSLFKTAQPKDWTSLEKAFADKATIVGTVTAVVKGGLHVDCGIRAFLPASRSGARDAAEMEKLIGQEIRVRITKLDVADEDLVVDRRVVTEEEAQESRTRLQGEIEEGAVVDGVVRTITDYGAFLDLTGRFSGLSGLLHISDIAWSRVAKVDDILTTGQQLEVKVLKIDPETRKLSLGLKQLQVHPWDNLAFTLGERVRGIVTRTTDFGAFIELAPGVEGLVHLSEMSYTKRILKATEVVKVGDTVDAVILAIDLPARRISLGLKQALGDPWVDAAARLRPGIVVEGPVASLTKFGAFIEVAEGIQGLVHISEIVPDRRLNHPSDVLRAGQVVQALVLELDQDKRQLKLSMKQLIPTSLDEFLAEHHAGDSVTGRIASIENNIARVELGEGIHCTCKLPAPAPTLPESTPASPGKVDLSAFSSMLKTRWKTGAPAPSATKPAEEAKPGQVRAFRIARIDAASKQIDLELVP